MIVNNCFDCLFICLFLVCWCVYNLLDRCLSITVFVGVSGCVGVGLCVFYQISITRSETDVYLVTKLTDGCLQKIALLCLSSKLYEYKSKMWNNRKCDPQIHLYSLCLKRGNSFARRVKRPRGGGILLFRRFVIPQVCDTE